MLTFRLKQYSLWPTGRGHISVIKIAVISFFQVSCIKPSTCLPTILGQTADAGSSKRQNEWKIVFVNH